MDSVCTSLNGKMRRQLPPIPSMWIILWCITSSEMLGKPRPLLAHWNPMPQWVWSTNLVHPHEVFPAGRGFHLKTVEEVTRLDTVQDELNVRTGILHPGNTSVRVMWCSGCGHVVQSGCESPRLQESCDTEWVWPHGAKWVWSCVRRLDTAHNYALALCKPGSIFIPSSNNLSQGDMYFTNFNYVWLFMSTLSCLSLVMWYSEHSTTDW